MHHPRCILRTCIPPLQNNRRERTCISRHLNCRVPRAWIECLPMTFSGAYSTTLAIIAAVVVPFTVFLKLWKSNEYSRSRKQHKGEAQDRAILPSPCRLLPSWFGFLGGHTLLISKSEQVRTLFFEMVISERDLSTSTKYHEAIGGGSPRIVQPLTIVFRSVTTLQYISSY